MIPPNSTGKFGVLLVYYEFMLNNAGECSYYNTLEVHHQFILKSKTILQAS